VHDLHSAFAGQCLFRFGSALTPFGAIATAVPARKSLKWLGCEYLTLKKVAIVVTSGDIDGKQASYDTNCIWKWPHQEK
jgi:hypothetical protein